MHPTGCIFFTEKKIFTKNSELLFGYMIKYNQRKIVKYRMNIRNFIKKHRRRCCFYIEEGV